MTKLKTLIKKTENCPFTGKLLHRKIGKDGRTTYRGGPYKLKDGRAVTTVVYISKKRK